MNPKTIDWDMFLGTEFGLAPDQPFDRAMYAQWRCYWDFGGGMFTDLFVHQLTHLIQAMGVRFPRRVVGGGGLYLEYDGRDVPDVATVVADYDEGCQVIISATMCNDAQLGEVIRGHTGTIKFEGADGVPRRPAEDRRPPGPSGREQGRGRRARQARLQPGGDDDTRALWDHFIECVRSRNPETLCPAETGYAAIATVNLGVESYREGKASTSTRRPARSPRPTTRGPRSGRSVSHERGKPNQVMGWHAGRPKARSSTPPTTRSSKATGSTARTPPRRPEPASNELDIDDGRPSGAAVGVFEGRGRSSDVAARSSPGSGQRAIAPRTIGPSPNRAGRP